MACRLAISHDAPRIASAANVPVRRRLGDVRATLGCDLRDAKEKEARRSWWSSKGKANSGPSGPFSSRLSGLPVGFSIPIQRGASEPNYYDSSPLDSVGPFDLPPFSMIPRYLGRAHCVLPVVGDPRAADRYGGVVRGPRTWNGSTGSDPAHDKLFINEPFFHRNLHFPTASFPSLSPILSLPWTTRVSRFRAAL